MDRTGILVIAALAAAMIGLADAPVQDLSAAPSPDKDVRGVTLVDPALFMKTHPIFTVLLDRVSPGQITQFGGPLQYYINTAIANPLSDLHRPFGANGVLPLARDRVELFGGIGGTYLTVRSSLPMPNAWLTQASLGARVALDQGHHIWVGGTAHYLADFAEKKRQWGYGSADLTFQFGR